MGLEIEQRWQDILAHKAIEGYTFWFNWIFLTPLKKLGLGIGSYQTNLMGGHEKFVNENFSLTIWEFDSFKKYFIFNFDVYTHRFKCVVITINYKFM